MGNFNRGGRSGGDRNYSRPSFGNRGSDRPVEMHQAVCAKCGKDCEVPFRPTNDRPVFCSSCFENNKGSESNRFESRSSERSTNSDEREMFDAVCDECGNSCQVPFRPSSGKPIYCSNCFGEKKEGGSRGRERSNPQPQYDDQLEQLNNKLDKILSILTPNTVAQAVQEEIVEEVKDQQPEEETTIIEEKVKVAKKKPSKKK